jgi:hypothetical protein
MCDLHRGEGNGASVFEELIRDVPAYAAGDQSPETRRRMFERDKDELREFGIPIETLPAGDEGDPSGYQLRVRDFYLPYLALRAEGETRAPRKTDKYGYASLPMLTFEAEEMAAIAEPAGRLRELGDPLLAEHAESAMRKLACDLPWMRPLPPMPGWSPLVPARRRSCSRRSGTLCASVSPSPSPTTPWEATPPHHRGDRLGGGAPPVPARARAARPDGLADVVVLAEDAAEIAVPEEDGAGPRPPRRQSSSPKWGK